MTLYQRLADALLEAHSEDAAVVIESLPDEDALSILTEAHAAAAFGTIERMAPHRAAHLLAQLEQRRALAILGKTSPERAANLLRRMEGEDRERLVEALPRDFARLVRPLMGFAEGTAGALMDPSFLVLPEDLTVQEANNLIKESPENVRYNLYVVDRDHVLVGVLNLCELLVAKRKDILSSIANPKVLSIGPDADVRAILDHPVWRTAHSLPVVDENGVYLGAIRYRVYRRLQDELAALDPASAEVTTQALAELFSTGIASVFGALAATSARPLGGSSQHEA